MSNGIRDEGNHKQNPIQAFWKTDEFILKCIQKYEGPKISKNNLRKAIKLKDLTLPTVRLTINLQ